MNDIDPNALSARERYAWLIASVIPRPIAWVSTRSPDGASNLAPFSFYMGVSATPPLIALAFGDRPDGRPKDTLANALDTGELVVNFARAGQADQVVLSSAELPRGDSEFAACGLDEAPAHALRLAPRLAGAVLSLECRTWRHERAGSSTLLLAEVVWIAVDPGVLDPTGLPDAQRLDPLSRLGGSLYGTLGAVLDRPRPRP